MHKKLKSEIENFDFLHFLSKYTHSWQYSNPGDEDREGVVSMAKNQPFIIHTGNTGQVLPMHWLDWTMTPTVTVENVTLMALIETVYRCWYAL